MTRRTFPACVLALALLLPVAAADPVPAPRRVANPDPVAELVARLDARVDNPIQPGDMTVKEYLEKLSKVHGIEIVVNQAAFREETIPVFGEHRFIGVKM